MNKALFFILFLSYSALSIAQVELDRPVTLTGTTTTDRAVKNLATPVDDFDAANKKYVDDQIAASSGGGASHMIGESFGGGIVYEVYKDINGTEHGLVVALDNTSNGRTWSGTTNATVPGGAQSVWNGLSNSTAIATQNGNSAAADCLNSTQGGFDDWFLPSISQLRLLWTNYYVVSRSITDAGGTVLSGRIWSSSEESSQNARFLNLSTNIGNAHYGDILPIEKFQSYSVRCVRIY